jgi:hypothetical protein
MVYSWSMLSSVVLKRDTSGSSIVEWNIRCCGDAFSDGFGFRLLGLAKLYVRCILTLVCDNVQRQVRSLRTIGECSGLESRPFSILSCILVVPTGRGWHCRRIEEKLWQQPVNRKQTLGIWRSWKPKFESIQVVSWRRTNRWMKVNLSWKSAYFVRCIV